MSYSIGFSIAAIAGQCVQKVRLEAESRGFRSATELKNAANKVLAGQRGGRTYRKPGGGTYTASAPGEPPANRTGNLRLSWRPIMYAGGDNINPAIETNVEYAELLEHGTPGGKIAPRPYVEKIKEMAFPYVLAIYQEPYNIP